MNNPDVTEKPKGAIAGCVQRLVQRITRYFIRRNLSKAITAAKRARNGAAFQPGQAFKWIEDAENLLRRARHEMR